MNEVRSNSKTAPSSFKNALRKFIIAIPGGRAILRARAHLVRMPSQYAERRRLASIGKSEQVFLHHYETNEWESNESVSGPGSTINYTENIRREIPRLVGKLAIQTILDAPCGDYNWFKLIKWDKEISYIGGDIVQPLVESNQSSYGNQNVKFIKIDIMQDVLPAADLWLCRDCLFHLSQHDIMLVIDNFLRSDIRYLLTTTYSECDENWDIPTGSFRLLNLQLPPYSFCKPITMIDDWIEGHPVRHLALWDQESLRASLANNKAYLRTIRQR